MDVALPVRGPDDAHDLLDVVADPEEIEVLGDDQNAPILKLSGAAQARADELGIRQWSVSISHSMTHAVAFAVAIGERGL